MATSGRSAGHRAQQVRPVVHRGGDLEAVRLEHPGQAVPQQEEVFGDDNAHGISMVTTVGPPGGLLRASTPSNAASRRSIPRRPVPRAGSAPPRPSSVTPIRSIPPACRMSIQAWPLPACLATLASSSLTAKYAADSTGGGGRPASSADQVDAQRAVQGQRADRVGQAAVGQYRRVDAADQVAQLGQRLGRSIAGLGQQRPCRGRVLVEHLPGGVQGHAHRHQPGLRAVVQVPLDPPQLRGAGVDGLGMRVCARWRSRSSSSACPAGASIKRANPP